MAGRGRRGPGASLRGAAGRARGPPPPCPGRVGGLPYSAGQSPPPTRRGGAACTTFFWTALGPRAPPPGRAPRGKKQVSPL